MIIKLPQKPLQSEWKLCYLKLFIQAKQAMSFTKTQNIPRLAVFLDFEKAFDSIEWN